MKIFRLDEDGVGYGQFSFEGSVVQNEEIAPFSGESFDVVYLVVANDGSVAFDYFQSYAEKNDSINKMVDGSLYFKLGILGNSALELGAELSEGTEEKILSALESGDSLRLTMLQAVTLGSGASEYSVMPCLVGFVCKLRLRRVADVSAPMSWLPSCSSGNLRFCIVPATWSCVPLRLCNHCP